MEIYLKQRLNLNHRLNCKKGSHYDSLRARLGNKREKPGPANVIQAEVFIEPPTESIDCGYNLELYSEGPANTGSLLVLLSRSDEVIPNA
jgi:hypothetical protein